MVTLVIVLRLSECGYMQYNYFDIPKYYMLYQSYLAAHDEWFGAY